MDPLGVNSFHDGIDRGGIVSETAVTPLAFGAAGQCELMESNLARAVSENLAAVRSRMAQACLRSGRTANDVRLVAVTKSAPVAAIAAIVEAGQLVLAENRPQRLLERSQLFPQAKWHLIGQLQRNKVRSVLPAVALIHSVDSLRLAERISAVAGELQITASILLEVNVSGEDSKNGFDPLTVRREFGAVQALPHLSPVGLMTMAPYHPDPEQARPHFARLRELQQELHAICPALTELSMGMSGDFEVAIEEGATLVRVGSALFENLPAA